MFYSTNPATDEGVGIGWVTSMVCPSGECRILPAHKYFNTTFVLADPSPEFGATQVVQFANLTRNATSTDKGKTWVVDEIDAGGFDTES